MTSSATCRFQTTWIWRQRKLSNRRSTGKKGQNDLKRAPATRSVGGYDHSRRNTVHDH
ncbi:hypothetical protein B0H19DRAFT_1122744 [Mycena capillaripes]|nr:hypothetical protein B0H19DRAFT_1203914 [Mycena capillaripes]KAJ6521421.1 hypothetical protein B0H19DRAFT_1203933 [Mycena capillaripes]KAJ6578239.1 hypothetical protein B0H19DRAFT_1122744 [Mycena capillaripes]